MWRAPVHGIHTPQDPHSLFLRGVHITSPNMTPSGFTGCRYASSAYVFNLSSVRSVRNEVSCRKGSEEKSVRRQQIGGVRKETVECVAMCCVALRCVTVRRGAVQCGAMWCNVVRCVALRCGAVRCGAVRCVALRCEAVWRNTAQVEGLAYSCRFASFPKAAA